MSRMCKGVACSQAAACVARSFVRKVPVSFSSPLVRLCGVWVDADGSVTVSYGRIGLLHLDINADSKKTTDYTHRQRV